MQTKGDISNYYRSFKISHVLIRIIALLVIDNYTKYKLFFKHSKTTVLLQAC